MPAANYYKLMAQYNTRILLFFFFLPKILPVSATVPYMSRPTASTGQALKKMPLPRPPPSPQCISSASPRQHSELSVFLHTDEDGGSPSNHEVTGSLAEGKRGGKKIDQVLSDFSSLLTRADKSSALIRLGRSLVDLIH